MAAEAAVSTAALKLADLLTQKANFLRGSVVGEVEQLRDALKGVQCFLRDAAWMQADDVAIRDWISETREVAHDAEDAVEVFMFKVERARVMLASIAFSLNHKYLIKKFGASIKSIRKRLEGIEGRRLSHGIRDLGDSPSNGVISSKRSRRLTQWQKDKHAVGLEEDVQLVLENAILAEGDDLTLSSITGVGGSGKSTLARLVHDHPAVAERFERRAFVVVSKELRPRDILKELYSQLQTKKTTKPDMTGWESLEMSELQHRLYKQVEGKRYFIVLDDMWDGAHWNDYLADVFPSEGTGSRFLFVTHNPIPDEVDRYVHTMKSLDSDKSWMLFLNTVSDGRGLEEDLEDLGRQIVNKCDDLPLAIILVGSILMKQRRSKSVWEKVLEEMNYLLNRSSNDAIEAILELSYQYLPPELKACFLCLGFFKADCKITAQKLVDIWISVGFIPRETGKTKEETAMAYLGELVDRNILQIKDISMDDSIRSCVVHDLLRDLSIRKAEEEIRLEILISEEGKLESSQKPHHRVLDCGQGRFNDSIFGNKHVRTLVVRGAQPYLFTTAFSSYWMSFQLLRVLDFECCMSVDQLPVSVGVLAGLRYLSLRDSGVSVIPNWLPRLINLEVLDIRGVQNRDLTEVFGKMPGLRHLYASPFYFTKPLEITGLKSLQTLYYVILNDADINKLTSMPRLSKLGVNMFRIIDTNTFFYELMKMENLVHLKLMYPMTRKLMLGALHRVTRLNLQREVPGLPYEFPPNLSHLTVDGLELREDPMPLLQKLPKLLHLKLVSAYTSAEIVILKDGFPALEVLILRNLNGLVEMRVEEGAMPELRRLEINRCSGLERLPEAMGGMRNLEVLRVVASKKVATKLRGEDSHLIANVAYVQIVDDLLLD